MNDTRGEILRLVAKLRASQGAAGALVRGGSAPSRAGIARDSGPAGLPAVSSAQIVPPRPERSSRADDRVEQRRRELGDIRQLRQSLEEQTGARSSVHATLERIEQRLVDLEHAVSGLVQRSGVPVRRQMTSKAPLGWSGVPPSRRAPPSSDPEAVATADRDLADCTFSGLIEGQLLSDMLQLVSSNALTGVFVVENEDARTEIFFEEGRICHAVGPNLVGELAFFAAFGSDHGRYSFWEVADLPEERTISSGTQLLILEALRQIDEKSNENADENADVEI